MFCIRIITLSPPHSRACPCTWSKQQPTEILTFTITLTIQLNNCKFEGYSGEKVIKILWNATTVTSLIYHHSLLLIDCAEIS